MTIPWTDGRRVTFELNYGVTAGLDKLSHSFSSESIAKMLECAYRGHQVRVECLLLEHPYWCRERYICSYCGVWLFIVADLRPTDPEDYKQHLLHTERGTTREYSLEEWLAMAERGEHPFLGLGSQPERNMAAVEELGVE